MNARVNYLNSTKHQNIDFDVDEGSENGEVEVFANETQSIEFFDNGGTKEDLVESVIYYFQMEHNMELEFVEFGNLHCRMYFNLPVYQFIKNIK